MAEKKDKASTEKSAKSQYPLEVSVPNHPYVFVVIKHSS